ncbi:MAG: hypothetical protein AAGD14_00480 [Planctomycetota bacterium]
MTDDRMVELTPASSPFEAELIVGSLKGFGIHAEAVGDSLSDEFAMSQQLMGRSGGIQVLVPHSQLEQARAALQDLEAARAEQAEAVDQATGNAPEEESGSRPEGTVARASNWIPTLSIACLILAGLCLHLWTKQQAEAPGHPHFTVQWTGSGSVERWRDNDKLARRAFDRDDNGVYEKIEVHDRAGLLYSRYIDADQNGVFELASVLDRQGNERVRTFDRDQNGRAERSETAHSAKLLERWLDEDEDGYYERCEMIDRRTGAVLWSGRIDPAKGWVADER